ncbi:MAG: flagellar hook-length control protein FliK [Lachnospiraceae bacterium]|nr:flagellar hook-length control protein FliK [Lachnospiraceae bacterium]
MIINGLRPLQLNIQQGNDAAGTQTSSQGAPQQNAGQGSMALSGGDTVTGQILAKSGNEVQISLGGDSVLTARMDISADLPVGSAVTFQVMSSDSNGITLSPLLTNTDTSSSLNTALMNAGLQIDARNLDMVSSMMERGMSIGKEELIRMNMSLSGIPDADVKDGVTLRSLGISPTADNIQQFHAYQGYEHQVSSAVNDIMDMVPQTIGSMIAEGDEASAIAMTRDILDIFTGQGAMEPMTEAELKMSGMEAPINMVLNPAELTELGDLLTENGIDPAFTESMARGEVSLNDVMYIIDDIVNNGAEERQVSSDTAAVNADASQIIEGAANGAEAETQVKTMTDAPVKDIPLPGETSANAAETVKTGRTEAQTENAQNAAQSEPVQNTSSGSAGLDFLSALKSGSVDADTLKNALDTAQDVNSHALSRGILKLIGSKPMATILQNAVNNQWKLTPGQVGEDKQVSDLYKRMTEQTNRLLDVLSTRTKEDTPLANSVNDLSKNMNFMNELNNMFNYIQLPMKMSGNDAHGELYVYSNKKNMARPDGNISALLHLDMDNLGTTDVYVTMNNAGHVNTHFYLPDDEALDLIAAHIDELNARIEKRGYSCSSEVSKREEMANIMQDIVDDNKSAVPISISNFDARA